MPRVLLTASLLLLAPAAYALPIHPFTDTETFAGRATEVLVADCLDPDARPGPKLNGVTAVDVEVIKVLKGSRKAGKAKLATIGQPMEKGRRYMMAGFGGSALGTDFLAQADLAVVEVPARFDLKTLDGKTVPEQMQLVFDARREQVRLRLIQLQQEKTALDRTAPKPKEPAKLDPPAFKLKGAVQRGDRVVLSFEVTNPNAVPLPYFGYTADSFEPKIPEGTISPLFKVEQRQGKEWKAKNPGWCGTGVGPVTISANGKVTFDAHVPADGWQEVRIGLVWYPATWEKDPQTAWTGAIDRKDVKKPE
jgi:hypothetical protein